MQAQQTSTPLTIPQPNPIFCQTFTMPLIHRQSSSSIYPIQGIDSTYTYIMHAWNLLHIDKQGNIIKELSLDGWGTIWNKWVVMNNLFLLWVKADNNNFQIRQWNIQANQSICLEITDCWPASIARMYIFQQTQLACFIQKIEISQTITKIGIQYYKYPLTSSTDKPIKVYEFKRQKWNRFAMPVKFNNHSGLIWHGYDSTFYTYDLKAQVDEIKQYQLHNLLGYSKDIHAYFSQAWQPMPNKIFIKYSTKQQSHQIIYNTQLHKIQHKFEYKNNPIIQFVGSIRAVQRYHQYDQYSDRWPPVMNSMYYYIKIPVIYVDIGSWNIVAYEEFGTKHNHQQSKRVFYCTPEYDQNLYLESIVVMNQESKSRQLRVMLTKINPLPYNMPTVAVFLLQQLLSQWDQDLLYLAQSIIQSNSQLGEFQPKTKQSLLLRDKQKPVLT